MITTHDVGAAQMGIPLFLSLFPRKGITVMHDVRIRSPRVWSHPIHRPAIIHMVGFLVLLGDGLVAFQWWAVLDQFFG